jgi:hypothetical protein
MKLGKAIQLLVLEAKGSPDIDPDDLSSAHRLGIEALKAYEAFRSAEGVFHYPTLPGETEK